jgi:hypothetical protein
MAILTWRDVAAPDFRGVSDSYETASRMLGQAMQAARGGIDDFRKVKERNATNEVMAEMLRYQDPESLQRDLASGNLQGRIDMRYASPEALELLASRPKELLALASDQAEFGEKQKLISDQDHIRNNRHIFNPYFEAIRAGDEATARKIAEANPEVLQAANTTMMQEYINKGQSLRGDDIRNDQSATDLFQDQTDYSHKLQDREVDLLFEEVKAQVNRSGLPEDHLRHLNTNYDKYVETHGSRAVNRLLNSLTNGFSPGGGTGGGAGGSGGAVSGSGTGIGGRNLYDVVLGDQPNGGNSYGFAPPKPVSQMTMGELFNYQRSVMVPETARRGVGGGEGSSAAGAYQIVSRTLERAAPKVFGDNWRNMVFTPQAQDQLGKFLFEEAKANGTDLHKVWEGLPAGTSAKNMTWEQARNMITRVESGGVANPQDLQTATRTIVQNNFSGDAPSNMVRTLNEAWQDKRGAREVAAEMVKSPGFEGVNLDNLAAKIREIMNKGNLNAAVAAAILKEASGGSEGYWTDVVDNFLNPVSDGLPFDYNEDTIDELINLAKDPAALADQAVSMDRQIRSVAESEAASQAVRALEQSIQQKQLRAAQMGVPYDSTIDMQLLAAARQAEVQAGATGAQAAISGNTNRGDRAPPSPQRGNGPSGAPAGARAHPAVQQARAITGLRGIIRQRQSDKFRETYGVTPEQALANPGALPAVGQSVTTRLPGGTPNRDQLREAARVAIAGGAAAIAAFQKLYGHHPRHFQ